jgi:hypothetical protein
MNQKTANPVDSVALDAAFEALRMYDAGSPRGALCALDEALASSLADSVARRGIESRLISILKSKPSSTAVRYICSKLVLVGSEACVPAVAEYLGDSESSTDARNTLERIPGPGPSKALRQMFSKLSHSGKVGVIQSLGAREDNASISLLEKCLSDPAAEIANPAAVTLGQIGSVKAAKALGQYLSARAKSVTTIAADAVLVCAERLVAQGHNAEAKSLYTALIAATPPAHVQQAASRGLTKCAAARNQSPGT